MNDLSNAALLEHHSAFSCKPIPSLALYILVPLFLIGLSVSIFILLVVHNAAFFVFFLLLSTFVLSFIAWNTLNRRQKAAISFFLRSLPDSDLGVARDGQLVKITGPVSCGSVSLESSYEKATRCIYTSTLLYEYGRLGLKPVNVNKSCFQWSLAYCERFSTDFYITDRKSGIRAFVKAGSGCNVLPLIFESKIVTTAGHGRVLSTHLRKWLRDRNLPTEARLLRVEEGYVQEGSFVTVIGMLRKDHDALMIVQPPQVISTGCLWQRLLLPVDVDGLILGMPDSTGPVTIPGPIQHPER
ncbi:Ubiquitin-specific protease family C19-related protein [Melia azedarach]|uniref:Ubiquitin-specific protease family C19-related protein n=1 Tax=Melia azedarach TaxID=155640 RepID=A0ACC1YYD7_MELAZ|nr:Ubiquitin-specific protease family C19-related protein [Melia azedarach]